LKPPSFHELQEPWLAEAVKDIDGDTKRHEEAWNQYGYTPMSDGWTDRRGHHLINFLINIPKGIFFIDSVDASSESHDAMMLAKLLDKRTEKIGRDKIIRFVTNIGANYKVVGHILVQNTPTLFWTRCAVHFLDLMLVDIGKFKDFKKPIAHARHVKTFICRHGKILSDMRVHTKGMDLVRPAATIFATTFLTLRSLHKNKDALGAFF
jgi:Xaa-Pro aminopeptidase